MYGMVVYGKVNNQQYLKLYTLLVPHEETFNILKYDNRYHFQKRLTALFRSNGLLPFQD